MFSAEQTAVNTGTFDLSILHPAFPILHLNVPLAEQIRVPTVIMAVNYAKVPKKRPKLCARAIRERDVNRCQYTGRILHPDEGSLDHVAPRSRGGKDAWESLVWSAKEVNQRKADRLPHEAGLKLLCTPRAPKELPVSALIRNAAEVEDWKLFLP